MANTLSLGSGNWGAKDSLLLGYYEDGKKFFPETFDVTRATGGTRVNKAGLIETPAEIGSEEITNGSFDTSIAIGTNGSGWSTVIDGTNTVAYSNGGVKLTRFNTNECKIYANTIGGSTTVLTSGKTYKLTYQVLSSTSNPALRYFTGSGYVTISNEIGVHSLVFVQGVSGLIVFYNTTNNSDITIDNVSVKEYNDKNLARIDYLDDAKGVLLTEPQSTNLVTNSNNMLASNWSQTTAIVTLSSNLNPSGDSVCYRVERIGSGIQLGGVTVAAVGETYTSSIYLRKISGSGIVYIKDVNNGNTQVTITDEWQRYSATGVANSANARYYYGLGLDGDVIEASFAQLERENALGYNGEYSTSYIPTNGSTVTRNKDEVTNGGSVTNFNSEEGVLYAEIAALANDGIRKYISLSDGTSGNDVRLYYSATPNQIIALSKVGGVTQFVMSFDVSDATQLNKIAVKYKENNFSLWVNGVEVATDTSGLVNAPNTLNELAFDGNGLSFYGKTKNIQVFNTALSDSDLLSLTTTGSVPYWTQYSAMATTLNYTNK